MPTFRMYPLQTPCLEIVPGHFQRDWMGKTQDRHAYRCLPMTVANCSGWELLSPCSFEASWDGQDNMTSISLRVLDGYAHLDTLASSHFGHGILSIRPGYVFVTDPGWGVIVRGAPNFPKDGIHPLEGLVETDWLPFSFTMNWKFTRPGTVRFDKGDPLAFVVPTPHRLLDDIQPEIHNLNDDPDLYRRYAEWREKRDEFIRKLSDWDPDTVKQGWQRNYSRGIHPDGSPASRPHVLKRALKPPRTSD